MSNKLDYYNAYMHVCTHACMCARMHAHALHFSEMHEEIKKISKEKVKTVIKKKVESHAIKYLNEKVTQSQKKSLMMNLKRKHTLQIDGSRKKMYKYYLL